MPTLTTKTTVPNVNAFYDRDLLDRALPRFVHTRFAQVRDVPRNESDTIKFRRYTRLSAATTPLTEGVTPVGSSLAVTNSSATLLQYGDYVTLTDKLDMETEDPIVMETNELLGEQVADTLDQLTRDVMNAGTNVAYASTAVSRITVAAGMNFNDALARKAARILKLQNARPITKMVDAYDAYLTTPLRPAFVAICHTNTTTDLEQMTAWKPVEQYQNSAGALLPGEVGAWNGQIRFIETTNAKVFTGAGAAGIDVYSTLVLGMDAYGVSRISGESLHEYVKALGSGGTEDPINQRSTIGWKASFVAKILVQEWMLRLEHSVSA